MGEGIQATLDNLTKLDNMLREGQIDKAISHMKSMNPDCLLCEEYLSDGIGALKRANKVCRDIEDEKNEEACKMSLGEAFEIVQMLKEAYSTEA